MRLEGSGKGLDVVIVPRAGERLRFPAAGDVTIETRRGIITRTAPIDALSVRVTFAGTGEVVLEQADVAWSGSEEEWERMWRRARMRSRPWWREEEQEIELDVPLDARLTIVGGT